LEKLFFFFVQVDVVPEFVAEFGEDFFEERDDFGADVDVVDGDEFGEGFDVVFVDDVDFLVEVQVGDDF
jgi:hypothetical protein